MGLESEPLSLLIFRQHHYADWGEKHGRKQM
jgi:hypothetical protein